MARILIYVAIAFLLAFGFAWLADRPGVLQLTWQGYTYEVSLVVAAVAIIVIFGLLLLVIWLVRTIVVSPRIVGDYFASRRRDRGYRALSRGMIAVGAGDQRTATRAADEASALLGQEPMTILLTAQAAQLGGNGALARTSFEKLAARQETRVLGLHGLFIEARRQGEDEAARHFAEEATQAAPKIGWAGEALFEYQAQSGEWLQALRTLGTNAQAKLVDKATAQRLRAVLLTAWALDVESSDPDEARAHAQEAHRLAPAFSEAAIVAGRLLSRAGDFRRASRVLETTWKAAPHPDIADTYATVRPGDSVRDRLKRVRRLAELRPNHPEGAMAVARAAVDAHDWEVARAALEGQTRSKPSERVCVLMAEIEQGEHGDEGRVRAWLARAINAPRDPSWIADGRIFQQWAPISPISGRIDAFEWKVATEPLSQPRMPEIDVGPDLTLPPVAAITAGAGPAAGGLSGAIETVAPAEAETVEIVSAAAGDGAGRAAGPGDRVVATDATDVTDVEASAEPAADEPGPAPAPLGEAATTEGAKADPDPLPEQAGHEPPRQEGSEVSPVSEEPEPVNTRPEEPLVPPVPDDPGPEPRDEGEKPRRGLFGYTP